MKIADSSDLSIVSRELTNSSNRGFCSRLKRSFTLLRKNDKFPGLINNFYILGLYSLIFASKCFKGFPNLVGRGAFTVLSYIGISWLGAQAKGIESSEKDLVASVQDRSLRNVVLTALKLASSVVDYFLTIGSFIAATSSLLALSQVATAIYVVAAPVGFSSFVVSVSLRCYHHWKGKRLVRKMDLLLNQKDGKKDVQDVINRLNHPETYKKSKILRSDLLLQVPVWNKASLGKKTFTEIKGIINGEIERTANKLKLFVVGQIGMGINKAYPDSLVQSGSNIVTTSLYTGDMIKDMIDESKEMEKRKKSELL